MNLRHDLEIIILSAGLGSRMKSDVPKVLHRVCGEPILGLLLDELQRAANLIGTKVRLNLVLGHGREMVQAQVNEWRKNGRLTAPVVITIQEKQLGTGHAARLALEQNQSEARLCAIFNGDLPLFTAECLEDFLAAHQKAKSSASLLSAVIDDAGQYGRVVRKGKIFTGVVEAKDATASQRKIKEYNGGIYLFDRSVLERAMKSVNTKNAAGEFYLPDVFAVARKLKKTILAHEVSDPELLAGVNTMKELAEAQRALYSRTAERLMRDGIFIQDPNTTYIGPRVRIGRGCEIGAGTRIRGLSTLGNQVRVGSHCELFDANIGDQCEVRSGCVIEQSSLGRKCAVGPMAHFRPGTKLADEVRVGNFVEIKESSVGSHTNAAHLSYIGDATIGSGVNLGCGFVTCNYDGVVREGKRKHTTVIGNRVFVGSDSQVVAPIEIADGTYIASGSTVTESVTAPDSLVLARTRQVTKPGYAKKYRK